MSGPGYTDIPAVIRVWDGMKLSASRQTEGAVKALLRDVQTNSLETHAEIFLVDKAKGVLKDLTTRDRVVLGIGAFALIGATVATIKIADRVRAGRSAKAANISGPASDEIEVLVPTVELATAEEPIAIVVGSEVDVTGEQVVLTMSAEDWQELLRKAVMLSSLEERIWMILSNVRIDGGDEDALEWQRRMKERSPHEVAHEIRSLLEAHPSLRSHDELANLFELLVDGQPDGGTHHDPLDMQ